MMKVGISHIDLTPAPGVELSGFAIRTQPSTGVLDPLFAKALYLEDGRERFLWVHCDVIGFEPEMVAAFRRAVKKSSGLDESRVMLSATHTHSGPATIRLRECGVYDPAYTEKLLQCLCEVAEAAWSRTEACSVVAAGASIDLAIDRRKKADAHTDPRVGAVGFRREDGTWIAVLMNHAMHPVALGAKNREISADIPGQAAEALARALPGNPVVLVTNGACGNLNPPEANVGFSQVRKWGEGIAAAIAGPLKAAPCGTSQRLDVRCRRMALPVDMLIGAEIDAFAQQALLKPSFHAAWGDRFRRAVEHWQSSMHQAETAGRNAATREVELMVVTIGEVSFVGVNAEVFSRFTALVRRASDRSVYVVGYANGVLGYLPSELAFAEGGYEVDAAHFFYGGFRFKAGALEQLALEAAELIDDVGLSREEKVVV
jgi:neutral ceramidase